MTLYRKYRPKDFAEFIGNKDSVALIESLLSKKNKPQVFLLYGEQGTGKTTAARIMAKKLGASGIDIREINSSSFRGIETARDIINDIQFCPAASKSIVYILDEAHKWTKDAQDAMLKPLEDTPDNCYFIICTTDLGKLSKPLLSRCTKIEFNPIESNDMFDIIYRAMAGEGAKISKGIVARIVVKSKGSARDALVLLESVIGDYSDEQRIKIINSKVIDSEDADIIELARMLNNSNSRWSEISKLLKALASQDKLSNAEAIRHIILGYTSAIALSGKMTDRIISIMESFLDFEPMNGNDKYQIILACIEIFR